MAAWRVTWRAQRSLGVSWWSFLASAPRWGTWSAVTRWPRAPRSAGINVRAAIIITSTLAPEVRAMADTRGICTNSSPSRATITVHPATSTA